MNTMLEDAVNHRHVLNARKRLSDREKQYARHNAQLARQAAADAEAIVAMIIEKYAPGRITSQYDAFNGEGRYTRAEARRAQGGIAEAKDLEPRKTQKTQKREPRM